MRRRVLIGAGVAAPVLAVGLFVGLRDPAPTDRSDAAGAAVLVTPAPVTPKNHPTFGEYVPPKPAAKPSQVPAPKPRTTPSRRASQPPKARQPCPQGWENIPMLRRWCQRHGYSLR